MNHPHLQPDSLLKSRYVIPTAIVVSGIIVAVSLYAALPKGPDIGVPSAALIRHVDATDHIFGNPAARVIVVEYADFDCEYCKTFNDTMHQVIANQGTKGDIAWVFREFPLLEIHPNALSHARAAECVAQTAGDDAFWKFETALYDNQPVDPASYGKLAKEAGVIGNAFATCYANSSGQSSTVEARILSDRQNALDMGANGTPYSVILVVGKDPVVMNGAYSYEQVKQLINQTLGN